VLDVPDAEIVAPQDVVVRVQMAGLCGSDLHAFFGRESGLDVGTVMGHEFVGVVVAVGADVKSLCVDDRVCAPFTTNCGRCFYCDRGVTARCVAGQLFGWRQAGEGLHGGQSEFVRVPLADSTLMRIPDAIQWETALLLGDNLSTGFFAADMIGITSDGVYAVVGCGTVGLLAIQSAMQLGAHRVFAIDPDASRRAIAEELGATVFADPVQASAAIKDVTDGRGADGVMELVGLPAAQQTAYELIRPGGTMSVIGCHCTPNFAFSPAQAYDKNLTYRTGRCPARHYMSKLLPRLLSESIDLSWCITHRFPIGQAEKAYDVFANRKDGCIKAAITF
tara:strand:+ start:1023623 stop:1024627 length:1005 start_codon:yes stop_codon:yes gene_type:complete